MGLFVATDFERIPEAFVERYLPEIRQWAHEFSRRGPRLPITLRGKVSGVAEFDDHGQRPVVMVVIEAVRERGRMVVRPRNEHDEDVIRRHVDAMRD